MAAQRTSQKRSASVVAIPQVSADQAVPKSIVLVTGPEEFFAHRAQQSIRNQLLARDPELEITDIEADGYSKGELFTLASPSLFGEPRLLRITAVEKCSDAFLEDALVYIDQPAEDTTLILRHSGGNRAKALLDAIRAGRGDGIEVVCPELKKEGDRIAFVTAELRAHDAKASRNAIQALVSAVPGSLAELAAACAQLVADVGSMVTDESVHAMFGGKQDASAFAIADTALAGNTAEALLMLRNARANGEDPIPLLAAINSKLRALARVFGAQGSPAQLARSLSLAPWQVERAQRDARRWREPDIARCIELAAETEFQLKGGGRDADYALEHFVSVLSRHGRGA